MATKEYELAADHFNAYTSEPGKPLTYKTYKKGDKIKLDEARAAELIDAGAIVDPSADDAGEPGGQTKAPKSEKGSGDVVVPPGEPAAEWTLAQLKAWGDANGVDLSAEKKKDDALATIAAARS